MPSPRDEVLYEKGWEGEGIKDALCGGLSRRLRKSQGQCVARAMSFVITDDFFGKLFFSEVTEVCTNKLPCYQEEAF